MTPYLDTSALIKLYVDEEGSDALWGWLEGRQPATCRITFAVAHAGIARREREAPLARDVWTIARERLRADWPLYRVVEVTQALVESAADFADTFGLRGYDAVQLAAAHAVGRALTGETSVFVSFDRRLNRAARLLGLELPEGAPC
ncbi:MAG: type II toxin-antitoxin system VapC family toxin [Rubrivivax sp.]|nr:type II toxin-antitoxin system VapC family toxin [Rubrivivax sp.]